MAATMTASAQTRSPHRYHHHQQQAKRARSVEYGNYYSSESASQGLYFDYHDQQGLWTMPTVTSRTSAMAAASARPRRASVATTPQPPVPFVESSAALQASGSDCRCCGCIAEAARAYNARHSRPQHAHVPQATYPRSAVATTAPPLQQPKSFGRTYNPPPTARRASDSAQASYPEYERHYYHLAEEAVRPAVSVYPPRRRSRREELLQSKHTDEAVPHNAEHDHDAIETQRGAKRRRTEQVVASLSSTLDVSLSSLEAMAADGDILDADQQQYWYYSEGLQLPASLAQSWASGVIQSSPTTTPSSPSSSSSSSPTSSSSLVASPHSVATADSRSSFSYQVVASPLPTLVLASASLSSSSCWSTPSGAVTPVSSPAMGFFSADGSSSLSSGTATTDNTLRLLRGDE